MDGDGARLPPAVPPADEVREARVEEVVAADHEQVLVLEPCAIDDELDVADRAEPVLLALCAVVVHLHVARLRPLEERGRELAVRDHVDGIDLLDLTDAVEQVVDERPARQRQQRLRHRLRERIQPRAVAGREDQSLHPERVLGAMSLRPRRPGTLPAPR